MFAFSFSLSIVLPPASLSLSQSSKSFCCRVLVYELLHYLPLWQTNETIILKQLQKIKAKFTSNLKLRYLFQGLFELVLFNFGNLEDVLSYSTTYQAMLENKTKTFNLQVSVIVALIM